MTPEMCLRSTHDTQEGTLEVARRTGAQATIMRDLGHFPMSENPDGFLKYLLPVLEKIGA